MMVKMVAVVFVSLVAIINGSVGQGVLGNLVGINTARDGTAGTANCGGIRRLRP